MKTSAKPKAKVAAKPKAKKVGRAFLGTFRQSLAKGGVVEKLDAGAKEYELARSPVELTPADMVLELRKAQELSQAELSELSGISQPTISGIEAGRIQLGVERAERLARALKVHPAVLLWPHWELETESSKKRSA